MFTKKILFPVNFAVDSMNLNSVDHDRTYKCAVGMSFFNF